MYYKRRHERRVQVLLGFGFVGFFALIPFANPDMRFFDHINDVSETCSNMTFLVQITIISRDINRKVKIRSLKWLTRCSEELIDIGVVLTLKSIIELVTSDLSLEKADGLDNIFEDVALGFIFVFRFYYIAISKGIMWLLDNRKMELFLYVLFVTHEYPFLVLAFTTGVSWESIQSVWHRLTMTICVLQTDKEKLRSRTSKGASHTSQHQPHKTHDSKFEAQPSKTKNTTVDDLVPNGKIKSSYRRGPVTTTQTRTTTTALSIRNLHKQGSVSPMPVKRAAAGKKG